MEKKDKFSIRKIKGVVGSILLMSIFVPIGMANASEFHYIDKSSLSEVEKSQIINGLPTMMKIIIYLFMRRIVYQIQELKKIIFLQH